MSNSTPSSPRNNIAVTEPSSPGTIEKGELHSRKSKKSSSPQRLSTNRKSTSNTHNNNAFIKYGSLLLLVGQMVGLVLLMRYTRTHTDGGDLYLASTAVFMMEVMKFCICLGVVFYQTGNLTAELHKHVVDSPNEMIKLCVPSFLYTIQNNLLYLALTGVNSRINRKQMMRKGMVYWRFPGTNPALMLNN